MTCNRGSILSVRILCSESTINASVTKVTETVAKTVDAEFMNITIICSRAACSTGAPARMAPVIIPGIEMIPMILYNCFYYFIVFAALITFDVTSYG